MPYLVSKSGELISIKSVGVRHMEKELARTITIDGTLVRVWKPMNSNKYFYFKYNHWYQIPIPNLLESEYLDLILQFGKKQYSTTYGGLQKK